MKALFIAATVAALAGCGQMQPWTPEQAAVFMQYQRSLQTPMAQPTYQPVYTQPQQAQPIRCQSSTIGLQTYTTCR